MNCSLVWLGREAHAGDEIDLPDDVAMAYIKNGSAGLVVKPVEQITETAAIRTTAPRGRNDVRLQKSRP